MTSSSPRAASTPGSPASSSPTAWRPSSRLPAVDIARTAALVGMIAFHFVVDLELFGHVPPGTTGLPGWAGFARAVAASFLFIAGVSLWLGHAGGIRWRPFLRRLAVLAAAAAGVTLVTRLAMPDRFVFFGILHAIAAASVIGLLFLRLPAPVTLSAAAAALAAPTLPAGPPFDTPALLWLGLSSWRPPSMDFVPLFPWLAPCLAGIAAARLAGRAGLWARLEPRGPEGPLTRALAAPGRVSLWVYIGHQPVLLAAIWASGRLL